MAYAYVGVVVPARRPIRAWSKQALTAAATDEAGFDDHELGGWFVRTDFVDEQLSGAAALERLEAAPATLHRDQLLRLYATIDENLAIAHRARLVPGAWHVRYSNRAWVAQLRSILTPESTLAIAIVHVTTATPEETSHVLAHQRQR